MYRIHGTPDRGKVYAKEIDLQSISEIENLRDFLDGGDSVLLVNDLEDAEDYGFDVNDIQVIE